MVLKTIITIGQLLAAVVLMTFILLQSRGTGLGNIFGGGGSESYRSKRGMEKILFMATIVTAALFLIISILGAFL
ncbi:MAG: preprotein translocase subunit SecG [Candidatus Marinimicrobia bacterium]|nr:preprotein translocase subunit SecG [Candidatus Neomarinimicrobiota bacterium]